ncbi:RHS repeat-associated core domain-containing protein [Vibrio splendidus]
MKTHKTLMSCAILYLVIGSAVAGNNKKHIDKDQHKYNYTKYYYNSSGLVEAIDGPRTDVNDITEYDYNAKGQVVRVTNALGHITEYRDYNRYGYPETVINANQGTVKLTYDHLGNVLTRTIFRKQGQDTTTYTYMSGSSLIHTITNSSNYTLIYGYDAALRLETIKDSNGDKIFFKRNKANNSIVISINDAQGMLMQKHAKQLDELNRLIKDIGAFNQTEKITYNAEGNPVILTDAKLNKTVQTFDGLNRLKLLKDAKSGETEYTYNILDQMTSITDARGNTTRYEYDGLGRLVRLISPDTGIIEFDYDNAGNLIYKVDNKNNIVVYHYDELNRLILEEYDDPKHNVSYEYDRPSNGEYGLGLLTKIIDESGTTEYHYNQQGQVIREIRSISGSQYVTAYQYNRKGSLQVMTYPSGRSLHYEYDNQNRLTAISTTTPSATRHRLVDNIKYNAFGPLRSFRYGNDITKTYIYDEDYKPVSIASEVQQFSYQYDVNSNITTINNVLASDQDQVFKYDELDRLKVASGDYGKIEYDYDAVHNRTKKVEKKLGKTRIEAKENTYLYPYDNNQLKEIITSSGVTLNRRYFGHDENGQMLGYRDEESTQNFHYNAKNRLIANQKNNVNWTEYTYNSLGQRVEKNTNGERTHYHYDLNGLLIAETLSDGTLTREYFFAGSKQVATTISSDQDEADIYYVHTDHLGTPTMLTDSAGSIQWAAHYTPFGKIIIDVDNINQEIRFPGQYFDKESGLHYNYFRDYDPELGRYIQSDPIGLAGGINTYGYAYQNPIMNTDPTGLWSTGFSLYFGVGAGFNVGYNPNTGQVFGNVHAGVGVEGGFSIDPNDNGNTAPPNCTNSLALSLGTEASWGANIGPYGIGASDSTDFFSGQHGNPNNLLNLQPNFNAAGVNLSAGLGAHLSFIGAFTFQR